MLGICSGGDRFHREDHLGGELFESNAISGRLAERHPAHMSFDDCPLVRTE